MALITCPECGSQISDKAKSCPQCGFVLHNSKSNKIKEVISKRKKLMLICLAAVIVCSAGAIFSLTGLTQYEREALENCQRLKDMLKDPNSFTLYEEHLCLSR